MWLLEVIILFRTDLRFPIKRDKYTQSVGRLLPHRLGRIFQELGYQSWISRRQSNGVDIKVYDSKNNLFLVIEALNWSSYSALSVKRKYDIIDNLSDFKCDRLLVYTCLENEVILKDLSEYSISSLKIGYQILPKDFYDFYSKKKQVESRRIDSKETKADIKARIEEYLQPRKIDTSQTISEFCEFPITLQSEPI